MLAGEKILIPGQSGATTTLPAARLAGPCRREFRREFEALFRQRHGSGGG
ncbi:MAG: hypothetical protein HRU02_17100 [Myxococcales bacterium]|nr:hypothetical protein [Myxococcales bacterium]